MANKTADNRKITLEKTAKLLTEILKLNGYTLRKEELKRGFGWKVVSGSCRIHDDRVIFVDRQMSPEDQVAFLSGYMQSSGEGFVLPPELLEQLAGLGWTGNPTVSDATGKEGSVEVQSTSMTAIG